MDNNEQQPELSRELEKVDRPKKDAEEISGGEMVASDSHEDGDSPVVEEFWERVVEFQMTAVT